MTKILIIDDEEHVHRALSRILRHHGFIVVIATNGLHGFLLALTQDVDVILTDRDMPELTGSELAEALRVNDVETPIMLMSGRPEADLPELPKLRKQGVINAFFKKPFATVSLLEAIKQLST